MRLTTGLALLLGLVGGIAGDRYHRLLAAERAAIFAETAKQSNVVIKRDRGQFDVR